MPQESANKGDWLSNPKFARRVLWVTVGTVGWLILMVFVLEMNLGPDRDSAWLGLVVVGPFAVAFLAMGFGFTLYPGQVPGGSLDRLARVPADSTGLFRCVHVGNSLIALR